MGETVAFLVIFTVGAFTLLLIALFLGTFLPGPTYLECLDELSDAVRKGIPDPPAWMIRFLDWLSDVADRLPPRRR